MDQQRRRLLAALVATGGLARLHRRDEPPRERQGGLGLEGADRVSENGGARQHVAGDGEGWPKRVATPVDARGTRVSSEAALPVHGVQLAVIAACIRRGEAADGLLGAQPGFEQRQPLRAVERVDEGLRSDGADPGPDVRHHRAHGEEAGGDDDADAPRRRVFGDDRPGHGHSFRH